MFLFFEKDLLIILVITINVVVNIKINNAILVGESSGSDLKNSSEPQSSLRSATSDNIPSLNKSNEQQDLADNNQNNTTFYYEANEFITKKPKKSASSNNEANKKDETEEENRQQAAKMPPPANHSMTSARNGRMMDLDALVGDFAASQLNKEKKLSGDRQSRFLSPNMDLGNGKRLHIQGFIPIVGVKDITSSNEDNENQENYNNDELAIKQHKQRAIQQAQAQINELPYAQSSIGHATFGVQRYLTTNEQPQQQYNHYQNNNDNVKPTSAGTATTIIETLKKPIKKIAGYSSSQDTQQHQQQQNCLCVPFYMCKNGYISESSLGKSQIQQMILQQQQQQQVNQYSSNQQQQIEMKSGHLISSGVVPSLQQQQQQMMMKQATNQQQKYSPSFESYPLIDERSFDRELITMAPLLSSSASLASDQSSNNQIIDFNSSSSQNSKQQQSLESQTTPNQTTSNSYAEEFSNNFYANSSAIESALNGAGDYSQEILGRMLGLKSNNKANSRQQQTMIGGAGQSTGVCGLLRTCCNIPVHLFPSQQDMANEKLMLAQQQQFVNADYNLNSKPQSQFVAAQASNNIQTVYGSGAFGPFENQKGTTMVLPQNPLNSLQRYNSMPTVNRQQLQPYGFPSTSNSNVQNLRLQQDLIGSSSSQIFSPPSGMDFSQQPPLAHRTSQLNLNNNKYPLQPVQQVTRAASQQFQSFQQPQLYQQQQPKAISTTQLNQRQNNLGPIHNNPLPGTRKILDGRCGLRQSAGINGRVQNLQYHESSADFGEYPAQVAILKRLSGSDSLFVCGGTLISQYWVATAAHCVKKHSQNDLKVRLGEWDVHRDDEFYPYVEKEIRDLIIHPDFVAGNLINDIALIRLDSPIDPSLPHINPACLPTIDETFSRQQCWVTGWGKDSFDTKGSFQAVLKEVELPIVDHNECEQALRSTRLGPHFRLHSGFICAGFEAGKDSCSGDGGGGLWCLKDGIIKVAGLVSWGIGCGQAGVPGVYVNLAHYRPWIENIISVDEDIYSPMTNMVLGTNSLINERSNSDSSGNNATITTLSNNNDTTQSHSITTITTMQNVSVSF